MKVYPLENNNFHVICESKEEIKEFKEKKVFKHDNKEWTVDKFEDGPGDDVDQSYFVKAIPSTT